MKNQLKHGRLKFISFIFLNLGCLILSNSIAVWIYLKKGTLPYSISAYAVVAGYMMVIDIVTTIVFNTLNQVLRRKAKEEIVESLKHVGISIVLLTLVLFSIKQGATYSRVTVGLTYIIYLIFMILSHMGWRELLRLDRSVRKIPSALLITTYGYAKEGLEVVENAGMIIKAVFVTDKTNEGVIRNIPTIVDTQDVKAFICWEWVDKVYICGPENIDIPEGLLNDCRQMGVQIYVAPPKKGLDYEVMKIRTAVQKNDNNTGLSFFEGEHDIPFKISRLYTLYESEQEKQKGFHAHKQSWHFMFCPYGNIDIRIDTGREQKTISLSDPSVGLILHPSVWREMYWRNPDSVLCVAASGHYDADRLKTDYDEYLRFLQEREWSATIESAEIMGGIVI